MSAPALDTRGHLTALKALLDPVLGNDPLTSSSRVYAPGTVPGADENPGTIPAIFVLVSVERRFAETTHMCEVATRSGWRYIFRTVGGSVAESEWAAAKVAEAIEGQRITVDGFTSTRIQHETTRATEKDDYARFSGQAFYTASF